MRPWPQADPPRSQPEYAKRCASGRRTRRAGSEGCSGGRSEHGGVCGDRGAMQEIGGEPNDDSRERWPCATMVEGFEGEAQLPLASPMSDIG